MKRIFGLIFFISIMMISAQQRDSLTVNTPAVNSADSLKSSAESDTSKAKKKFDVDAVVYASASDSLVFKVADKKMFVYGSGELKYKQTDLRGGRIDVDYNTNELEAFGVPDSTDSTGVKLKDTPVLTENGEAYEGARLRYNFKTQQGFISMAKNKAEDSRYQGDKVKKVDKDTYFIENGMFTTCPSDTPHTYFTAAKMKVIQNDKIIAEWIFMHIGGVPLPIPLPFAVFPNETGRRSGLIIPTYGLDARRGSYFNNFGYFLALSDYFDLAFTGDYYTKGGYGLRSRLRYAKRYDFTGSLNIGYSRIKIGESNDPLNLRQDQRDWNFSLYHNQQIDPTSRLDVNLQFQSSSYLRNNSIDYNDLLSQNIISNASYSKRWDESGTSLNLNYSRTQNLSTGDIYETLPSLSFNKTVFYPFAAKNNLTTADKKWYEYIGIGYNGQLSNRRTKRSGVLESKAGAQHIVNISASPKLGYFNVSPTFNYTEKWYPERTKIEKKTFTFVNQETGETATKDSVVSETVKGMNFVRTFDMAVSASTKLYGIFQPDMFGIEAFRHTLIPSISYNYTPDFADDTWGYYDTYTDLQGRTVRYDKYQNEIYSGVSSGKSQSLNFSLGNVFEIKTIKNPADTTSESKRIQLLNLSASVGYNFEADSLKLSPLSLSYRTQIGEWLNFSGASSYTFYDYQDNRFISKSLASAGKGLLRLTSFTLNISTNLSGDKIKGEQRGEDKTAQQEDDGLNAFKKTDFVNVYKDEKAADFTIPWNLNLSYNFNLSKNDPSVVTKFSNLSADLSFSLTKNWKFTFRGSYDFDRKELTAPQITVYRDLHCWEMNLIWNPMGYYRGFRFEIRMKAPEFRDIKVTKASGLYSGR